MLRVLARSLFAITVLLLIALSAVALSYFRPWAEYRPSTMNSMFDRDKRVEYFRSMERVFPYREIAASSTPQPFPLGEHIALPETITAKGSTENTKAFLERTVTTSLLVVKNGKIVHETYGQGATKDSRHTSWSAAKSFVATLVGAALADGKIKSLDDRMSVYLPELKGKDYGDSSIRSLLQMASGVAFDETYHYPLSDINWFFYRTFILGQRADSVMLNRPRVAPPGTQFDYVSSDTQLLGALASRVYQMPLAKLVEQKIWQPLGMESKAIWSIDRDHAGGQELGFCCLNATARDYAKFGQWHLQNGVWQGQQLLPAAWVKEATTPSAAFNIPKEGNADSFGYGFQWWVPGWAAGGKQTEFIARGHWGQSIYVNTEHNVVVVRTSVDPRGHPNMAATMALFRWMAANAK